MKYVYSVIRFVPDPSRGEFINVGAIAGSEESSEWEIRQIENPVRARGLDDHGTLDAVWSFIDRVGHEIDDFEHATTTLLGPNRELSEEWLEELHRRHRNIVQLSPPVPVIAESASEALERVFNLMVEDPARLTFPFIKKHRALAAVRTAFRSHDIEKGLNYFERVIVEVAQHRERLDFAVANGRALQLTQTWSFQVPNQDALSEQVKAWGWTMRRIREDGGALRTMEHERFEIERNIDVEVVYVPPSEEQPSRALEDAFAVFRKVDAIPVTFEQAEQVAERAEKLLIA
jgi:hypothetical protein